MSMTIVTFIFVGLSLMMLAALAMLLLLEPFTTKGFFHYSDYYVYCLFGYILVLIAYLLYYVFL